MPRFLYRAIRVKDYANSKTRRGYWNGVTAVTSISAALLYGRLYKISDTVKSLAEDGLSPEVVEVSVESTAANVLPYERATVPTFTFKRSSIHTLGPV